MVNTMPSGDHGAAPSALGYRYQTTWALLELLRRAPDRPDASISLEMHDDVAWDADGTPQELLSLKHHVKTTRNLADGSDDLWRTLRVWMDTANPGDPLGPMLTLVTTARAAVGSAAALLREDADRYELAALEKLRAAANDLTAETTATARRQFLDLSPVEQQVFISRIVVADAATPVEAVDDAVSALLWSTLPPGHEDLFLGLLWRWWDAVALDLLRSRRGPVDVAEARVAIADIRDRFTLDNVPTLVELVDVDEAVVLAAHDANLFVEQMRWVEYVHSNLRRAVVDYHRAVTQTTNWLDRDLIGLDELRRFEDNLRDEWGRAFNDMLDDLGPGASEETKVAVGKKLLRALLESTAVAVRPRYNDPFFARGKRHELADGGRIGWHPDFEERVRQLLESTS
jgi:hypothetical protein